jgi:hypothetical protein
MPTNPVLNTPAGETQARELLIAYLNTGTSSSSVWNPFGLRVEDSSIEYDWGDESAQDILGNTHTTMKKPTITQSFEPYPLDSADLAITKIYETAIINQNPQALANMDVLVVHWGSGATATPFAERYPQSAIKPTSLGGEGGGNLSMPIDVTYGGTRVTGTASKGTGGVITFTPAA